LSTTAPKIRLTSNDIRVIITRLEQLDLLGCQAGKVGK
jgi:hypothetical protein